MSRGFSENLGTFFLLLALCLLRIRQESSNDAEQWQEGTHLEDELDARLVGKPSEESRAQSAQSKHQSEENACNQSYLVWH